MTLSECSLCDQLIFLRLLGRGIGYVSKSWLCRGFFEILGCLGIFFCRRFLSFWLHRTACRILVPQPGIEPVLPMYGILITGLPGKPLKFCDTHPSSLIVHSIPFWKINPNRLWFSLYPNSRLAGRMRFVILGFFSPLSWFWSPHTFPSDVSQSLSAEAGEWNADGKSGGLAVFQHHHRQEGP